MALQRPVRSPGFRFRLDASMNASSGQTREPGHACYFPGFQTRFAAAPMYKVVDMQAFRMPNFSAVESNPR